VDGVFVSTFESSLPRPLVGELIVIADPRRTHHRCSPEVVSTLVESVTTDYPANTLIIFCTRKEIP
jgi:hypothetical protein